MVKLFMVVKHQTNVVIKNMVIYNETNLGRLCIQLFSSNNSNFIMAVIMWVTIFIFFKERDWVTR